MSTFRSELSNLLPEYSKRAFRRAYFVRVATVAVFLAIGVVVIHGVLLIPTYLYARGEAAREQTELDTLTQKLAQDGTNDSGKRIASVQADVLYLNRLSQTPTASDAIRGVLGIPHPSIHISGFTFTAPKDKADSASMTVSGTADSRDALRAYVIALGQAPFVSNADLPISAYAKETDIPFTITLTGTLMP